MEFVTLKVKSDTNVKKLAGSISHVLKGDDENPSKAVEILAIGAGSVNQAVKGIAISSGHLANCGMFVTSRIGFKEAIINGEERTIMRFIVEAK